MTAESMGAGDPRRILVDARALARRVRLDQRVTWVALLVLAAVTLVAIPVDLAGTDVSCTPVADGGRCQVTRGGAMLYWPPALLLAYAAIAVSYMRIVRARGLTARVLPYVFAGAALTVIVAVVWLLEWRHLATDPPVDPYQPWILLVDRLFGPAGTIGLALLVLAWLERHTALLVFTLAYLTVVLAGIDLGWGDHWWAGTVALPQQAVNGAVLLLGAIGFAAAARRRR